MPIYEYRCERCGHRFDALQRVGDDGSSLHCPECGHQKVEKQFSAFATASSGEAYCPIGGGSTCSSRGFS